jgi:hypothetical protein
MDHANILTFCNLMLIVFAIAACLVLRVRLAGFGAMLSIAAMVALILRKHDSIPHHWIYRQPVVNVVDGAYAVVWSVALVVVANGFMRNEAHDIVQSGVMFFLALLIGMFVPI